MDEAGENPVRGVRAQSDMGSFNSAGVGSSRPGDRRDRVFDRSRGPSANPKAAKSSTTRGPQGLASDSDGDGAEPRTPHTEGNRDASSFGPQKSPSCSAETMPGREPGTYGVRPGGNTH